MPQRQTPDPGLKIETPVIQSQDLEHQPGPDTRVNTKGVVINPPTEPLPVIEIETLEDEDEKSRDAVAEFEKQYQKLPPG